MARSGLDVDFLLFENRFGCAVTFYDTMVHYPLPHFSRLASISLDFTLKLHTLSTANEHCSIAPTSLALSPLVFPQSGASDHIPTARPVGFD